jgi:hypothetical protein
MWPNAEVLGESPLGLFPVKVDDKTEPETAWVGEVR